MNTFSLIKFSKVDFTTFECELKTYFSYYWHFWTQDGFFEIKMIKKICLGVIRFEIGGLQRKLWMLWVVKPTFENFINENVFKSLWFLFTHYNTYNFGLKVFIWPKKIISEKKIITKIFEKKKQFFSKSLLRGDSGGTFCLLFGIYIKFDIRIHQSWLRPIQSTLQHRLSD